MIAKYCDWARLPKLVFSDLTETAICNLIEHHIPLESIMQKYGFDRNERLIAYVEAVYNNQSEAPEDVLDNILQIQVNENSNFTNNTDICDDEEYIDFDDEDIFDKSFKWLGDDDENIDVEDNNTPPSPTRLSDLPNLGASMVKRLRAVGICTIEDLIQAKTEDIWNSLFEKAYFTDCVEIWSIEGAKQGLLYADLDEDRNAELKEYVRTKKGREKPYPEALTILPNIGVGLADKLKEIGITTNSALQEETT